MLLGSGVAVATAGLLSGCGAKPLREKIRSGAKVPPSAVDSLNALLNVEHYAIAAYTAGAPLLGRQAAKAAQQLLSQELAHAVELSDLITRAGGKPNKPHSSYDLGHPRTANEVLALLERSEQAQLKAYLEVIPRLEAGRLRAALAAIFANDAQHLTVLRWQTGQAPVPTALVLGS
jgi:bacterioferritin (cytochrome b1)